MPALAKAAKKAAVPAGKGKKKQVSSSVCVMREFGAAEGREERARKKGDAAADGG